MEEYIRIRDLKVAYGGVHGREAVRGIDLTVRKGHIFGFLGPNGAGKTTTIKTMVGLIPEYRGEVLLFGERPATKTVNRRIGFMPEIANYYWYLTPREALALYGSLFGLRGRALREKIETLLSLVDLTEYADMLMKTFSKGMMQKLSFAQALINDPLLLILDEPMSGLDPVSRMRMRDVLRDLRGKGTTIFFSSHELSEVELICDQIAILKAGRVLCAGDRAGLLANKSGTMTLEQYFLQIIGEEAVR